MGSVVCRFRRSRNTSCRSRGGVQRESLRMRALPAVLVAVVPSGTACRKCNSRRLFSDGVAKRSFARSGSTTKPAIALNMPDRLPDLPNQPRNEATRPAAVTAPFRAEADAPSLLTRAAGAFKAVRFDNAARGAERPASVRPAQRPIDPHFEQFDRTTKAAYKVPNTIDDDATCPLTGEPHRTAQHSTRLGCRRRFQPLPRAGRAQPHQLLQPPPSIVDTNCMNTPGAPGRAAGSGPPEALPLQPTSEIHRDIPTQIHQLRLLRHAHQLPPCTRWPPRSTQASCRPSGCPCS